MPTKKDIEAAKINAQEISKKRPICVSNAESEIEEDECMLDESESDEEMADMFEEYVN